MNASFESHSYNISALLGRTSFPDRTPRQLIVPKFQRSYSWEKNHVATFWDDIRAFHEQIGRRKGQDTYFLGPIVVMHEKEKVHLLDGQQRLATLTILLSVIRDLASRECGKEGEYLGRDIQRDLIMLDEEKKERSLVLGELDDSYFSKTIQSLPAKKASAKLRSHRLILQAKQYLEKYLTDEMGDSIDFSYLKDLKKAVSLHIRLVAIEVNSEEEAFLIFETLNDRGLRLAVPDLALNHLMRTASTKAERVEIRRSWDTVVENLGTRKVSSFMRHMWVSWYGDVKSQSLFREIRQSLADSEIESSEFASLCEEESERYSAVVNVSRDELPQDSVPNIQILIKDLKSERSLPLLLSGLASLSDNDFTKLSKMLLTVVVRHSIFSNLNPLDMEDALYKAARTLREIRNDGQTSRKALAEAKRILQEVNPKEIDLSDVFLTKREAQYVVYAIAKKIQTSRNSVDISENSIEHIFPENAIEEEWSNIEEMEPYVWHIGNLSVLEKSLNRDAGNKAFSTKKKYFAKSDLKIATELANDYKSWNESTVLSRAQKLTKIATQLWPSKL